MKNFCISLSIIGIIILTIVIGCFNAGGQTEYLRIHVRANSDSVEDQSVKYEVRDEIVTYLAPYVAECDTKRKAIEMLNAQSQNIQNRVNKFLRRRGFDYGCKIRIDNEYFPTRVYDGVTLDEGCYDAVIVELGSGKGNNWWCIVYPPLCFTKGEGTVKYRSKIEEIIEKFLKDNKS